MESEQQLVNLDALINFSASLTETYDIEFILNAALLSIMGKLKIVRACVLMPDDVGHLSIMLVKGKLPQDTIKSNSGLSNSEIKKIENLLNQFGIKYYLPIIYQNQTLAILCLGQKLTGERINKEEERYLSLIASITANALQNAINHQSLLKEKLLVEERSQLLTTLFEISRDFSNLMSREEILKMLSFHLMGQLMISRFAVLILKEKDTFYSIFNRFNSDQNLKIQCRLELFNKVRFVDNIQCDYETISKLKELGAEIIAPMMIQNQIKGLLIVGKKLAGGDFTSQNISFIEAIASIAMMSLENERLFKEEIDKKLLEREVKLALEIQRNLLPGKMPSCENFDIYGATYPSRYVGGDYFDFIKLSDGRLFVAIADVSGKGVPASLIMASVQAVLKILTQLPISLIEIVNRLNRLIYENTTADKFVTFFCCIIDDKNRTIEYVNAGHNPPILLRHNFEIERLRKGGLIMGFMDNPPDYEKETIKLELADIILLYTDGVSEAMNQDDIEFGEDRIINIMKMNKDQSSEQLLMALLDSVKNFSGEKQFDDITAVVIKSI